MGNLPGGRPSMKLDAIKAALLASYETDGGINHLDGVNLPSQESVNEIARQCMHLLFPGYFEERRLSKKDIPDLVDSLLEHIGKRLEVEIEKCLRFSRDPHPASHARVLYNLGVPLLPRMITEFAHERTGMDIHPGARIGTHFFIDHGTGVVIGETATIGSHVKLYQGVTLGAKSFETDTQGNPVKGVKRHPDIGDHVTIYAQATILGGDTSIGANSVIGGNVWLLESVPANSIAYFKSDDLVIRPRQKKEALVGYVEDWVI